MCISREHHTCALAEISPKLYDQNTYTYLKKRKIDTFFTNIVMEENFYLLDFLQNQLVKESKTMYDSLSCA